MKIIISAGGTGGHIYPAIELAKYLQKNNHEILFVSSSNDVAKRILKNENFNIKYYNMQGFKREKSFKSIIYNLNSLFKLIKTFISLIPVFIKFKPNICIGFGSYITYPVIKLAKLFKLKTYIHEQNSYPGLVNRLLKKSVDKIFITYKSSQEYFNTNNCIYTQTPRIYNYNGEKKEDYILFLGGSLGAEKINQVACEYAKINQDKVYLISGKRYFDEYVKYENNNFIIKSYADDLLQIMANAKVIVTRAGASTLLEAVSLEKKIIAVPSPNVVNDHQMKNAQEFFKQGYLKILPEENLSLDNITKLINDPFTNYKYQKINACKIIAKEMGCLNN